MVDTRVCARQNTTRMRNAAGDAAMAEASIILAFLTRHRQPPPNTHEGVRKQ